MKKGVYLLGTFLLVLFIFSLNAHLAYASDHDEDNIDDEFEELNFRDLEITFETNETEIESRLRNGDNKDEIDIRVRYDEEGIEIEVSYESDYTSEEDGGYEIEFGTSFRTLIEYLDLNDNDIYDPSIDNKIKEYGLVSFQSPIYIKEQISSQTSIHHLIIKSTDGIFTLQIYFPEEFFLLNNTLITPSKPKIDIEINNFNFLNNSSKLALEIKLESNGTYEERETTEDEEKGYAFNEKAVSTINNDFIGIFSWNENASIDGISSKVIASNIEIDDHGSEDQKLYLNYEQGTHIYHDPKIGLEGILRSASLPSFPWYIVFIILVITAVSISVAIPIYYYIFHNHDKPIHSNKTFKRKKIEKRITITDLSELKNVEVTALTERFYDIINQFEWDTNEKEEFLKEMFSLTLEERNKIIKEMVESSKLDKN